MPFKYFNEKPVITPESLFKPVENWPETAIVTWQKGFWKPAAAYDLKQLPFKQTSNRLRVSELTYKGKLYSFSEIGIGGPFTSQFMEEMTLFGTKNFVFVGSCGELVDDISGKLIIPDRAYRDEGTSWHYIPDTEEYIDVETVKHTEEVVKNFGLDYSVGNVWTTDAVYRETPSAVAYYRDKGCVAVDMECASIMAVARYKNVKVYQILFTADNLAGKSWKKGRLLHMAKTAWEVYLNLALEIADSIS